MVSALMRGRTRKGKAEPETIDLMRRAEEGLATAHGERQTRQRDLENPNSKSLGDAPTRLPRRWRNTRKATSRPRSSTSALEPFGGYGHMTEHRILQMFRASRTQLFYGGAKRRQRDQESADRANAASARSGGRPEPKDEERPGGPPKTLVRMRGLRGRHIASQ
jgi:hypothetical protein